jgi:type II secretory pathway component GspD/PulD (secretin)
VRALLVLVGLLAAVDARGDARGGDRGDARDDDRPRAGRELCARAARHHGAPIDLDVKGADIRDVFRLIADAGHVNLVVSDDVSGRVTLRLARVAWDAVACVVAEAHHLTITVHDNILLVMRAAR